MKCHQIIISTLGFSGFAIALPLPAGIYSPLSADTTTSLPASSNYPWIVNPYSSSGNTISQPVMQTQNRLNGKSGWSEQTRDLLPARLAHPPCQSHDPYYPIYQLPVIQEQESFVVVAVVAVFFFAIILFEVCVKNRVGKALGRISPDLGLGYLPVEVEKLNAHLV